ncbi:MAG: diguanylate cyclase [Acidobacteriota bacterium]
MKTPPHSIPLRALIAGVFVLAILSLVMVGIEGALESSGRTVGVQVDTGPQGLEVLAIRPGGPAALGGLRAGDLVLSVDGQGTGTFADYDRIAKGFRRGVDVDYEVERDGRPLDLTITPGTSVRWWTLGLRTFVALVCLGLGLFSLHQLWGDLRARLMAAFAFLLAFELALPLNLVGTPRIESLARSLFLLLTGAQMAVELHLVAMIPDRRRWLALRGWIVPLFYLLGLGLGVASWGAYVTEVMGNRRWLPWTYGQADALLFDWGLPLWALAVVGILGATTLRHREPLGRLQAGLIFLGVLPWAVYVLSRTILGWFGRGLPGWAYDLFPLIILCLPVAVFVSIFRFHLFDLALVVRRSFLYTALTSCLVLVFYAAAGVLGIAFSRTIDQERVALWVMSAAMFVVGMLFGNIRRAIQHFIDSQLFPERRALRHQLIDLASELPTQGTVAAMGGHLVRRLRETFGLRSATLLLADPKSGLLFTVAANPEPEGQRPVSLLVTSDDPALELLRTSDRPLPAQKVLGASTALAQRFADQDPSLAVPLLAQERLVGLLMLGKRTTAQDFGREEGELLSLLGHQIATSFENIRLFESATYESLTGLLRREPVIELLDREIERARRYGRPLVVGMADLDHFKKVNDQFGHLGGDVVLKRVAEELSAGLRSTDAIGRYGGEEFLLVLPETPIDGGVAVAEKLRRRVEDLRLTMDDGSTVRTTLSIGLSALAPGEGGLDARRGLIDNADRALYLAKERGRNRVESHTPVEVGTRPKGAALETLPG